MANPVEEAAVRKSVRVKAPIERAFSVFVEQMETWWPSSHHLGKNPFEMIVIEPRVGGRWYERGPDGEQCDWGKVLHWDPPRQVRFSWHIGPVAGQEKWGYNPDMDRASEVEIRFTPEDGGMTLIELEHCKLERHGGDVEMLRTAFDRPDAWGAILESYTKIVEARGAQ